MKRQRNRRGFTLAETLAALVIVVLLAMSVQMGTMTALRTRTASRFQSESEILAATLNSALGDMLHYATCARYDGAGGTVYLNNPGYGIVNGQILDRGGRLYVNATANISVDSEDATLLTLTGAGAYTDLTVSDFQIAYLWPDCMFTGSYVIHGPEQAEKEIQFAFRAINEIPSAGARG